MRNTLLIFLSIIFFSCSSPFNNQIEEGLISNFGEQPSVAIDTKGNISVVFGEEESIYISSSVDEGETFSEPRKIAELKDLYLGYSSGPRIAITIESTVVTAMNKDGNYFAWSKSNSEDGWSGPIKINDIDGSAAEVLGDLTATPDGKLYAVWIDTRKSKEEGHDSAKRPKPEHHSEKPAASKTPDLNKMTPIGITVGELYEKIGDIPEDAHLAFFGDEAEENILWVFLDKDGNALKAENIDEFRKFRERNSGKEKPKGKIYMTSSEDEGRTWAKSWLVYKSPDGSVCECCKPSITSDVNGELTVMFRNNVNGSRDLHFTTSSDGGKTFLEPEKLGTGTWKINGCPMDGGGLMVNNAGVLSTIWQREGEVFTANSSAEELLIGKGRAPAIATTDDQTYIVFASGEDIMALSPDDLQAIKIGTGSSPKVIALVDGAIQFWVSDAGINYRKI